MAKLSTFGFHVIGKAKVVLSLTNANRSRLYSTKIVTDNKGEVYIVAYKARGESR